MKVCQCRDFASITACYFALGEAQSFVQRFLHVANLTQATVTEALVPMSWAWGAMTEVGIAGGGGALGDLRGAV